jgi:segregation and condensation protein A
MAYQVKLDNFEGPLDLLLFLIQENEIDIYDIPISLITGQFLEYLDLMKMLDLEVGSEYLLMAATLLRIKAKMLLPRRLPDEESEEGDPREELVQRLLEYRQYKEAAFLLGEQEEKGHNVFFRETKGAFEDDPDRPEDIQMNLNLQINLWDLLRAFKGVLDRAGEEFERSIERETVSIEERMTEILFELQSKSGIFFRDLFHGEAPRFMMVVTFLALLELIRQRRIGVEQPELLGDIWVTRQAPPTATA